MSKMLANFNINLNFQKIPKVLKKGSKNKNEDLFKCKCIILTVIYMPLAQITSLLISGTFIQYIVVHSINNGCI